MESKQFQHRLFLQLLLSLLISLLGTGVLNQAVVQAADITSATTFAPWTQGLVYSGSLKRNLYGYMVDNNNIITETSAGSDIKLTFNLIAYDSWDKSPDTKYYLLTQTGSTPVTVQALNSSQITRQKVATYTRTALWSVTVTLSNIQSDKVQLVIYDNNSSYGFWDSNGVGDDKTYDHTLISPVIGWNQISYQAANIRAQNYIGEYSSVTFNSPVVPDKPLVFDSATLNQVTAINVARQTVTNNELQTTYVLNTDPSEIENTVGDLLPQNDTDYGRKLALTYQLPSASQTQSFLYGGLKNITLGKGEVSQSTLSTKDYLAPDFVNQITTDIGNNLTYKWFYATSAAPTFKEVGSDFADSQNSSGTLGQDWLAFPKDSKFLNYAAAQNQQGHQVYLLMKLYSDNDLKTLTNPILVQVTNPSLQVPEHIDFGTIGTTKLYSGGQVTSQSAATDQVSVNITGNWQLAASLGTEPTNSIRKLNGWLSFGAGQPLSADQAVTVANGTGAKTLPLNAKLNLKGYHHPLPTSRNFSETITWNLTAQPTPSAAE